MHLLIEAADSSLPEDRTIKAGLYAHFAIQEYWIVDLTKDEVIVHRNPENGVYGAIHNRGSDQYLQIAALPAITVHVAEIFE